MTTEAGPAEGGARTRCTICGETGWFFVREGGDLHEPGGERRFKLSRCASCGHIMQTPLPSDEELRRAYSVDYAPHRPAWKETGWPPWKVLRELTTQRRIRRLKHYGKGHKLLEVGSGGGDFLYAARRAGWDVRAVEYSNRSAEAVRSDLGFDVRTGELRRGLWKEREFDVVVLWSVLEHVRDPLEILLTAGSYLRPEGLLLLQLPTLYGIERGMWFGEYWALLDLPRHLNFFSMESLAYLCNRAGMDMVAFKTPILETSWCYFTSSYSYVSHAGNFAQKLLRSLLAAAVTVFALPYMALGAWGGRGTEAFAVAVKRPG